MAIGVASVVVLCSSLKCSHHYSHISSKTKCMPQLCKQSTSPHTHTHTQTYYNEYFTINEACCFITDDSDRE